MEMIPCTIIRDIMPIYLEDGCLDETKVLIQEHLQECEQCREYYRKMNTTLIQEDMMENNHTRDKGNDKINKGYTMKKAFTKIRNRWIASLIIVIVLMIVVIPNAYLLHNEINNEGICYSNLDEIYKTRKFLKAMKDGNYEEAFKYMNVEYKYSQDTNYVAPEKTMLEEDYRKIFIENEVYYVKEQVYLNEYAQYVDNRDVTAFWRNIYLTGVFMIPEEDFNTLLQEDLKELGSNYETCSVTIEGEKYIAPKQMLKNITNNSDSIDLVIGSDEYSRFVCNLYDWTIIPQDIYEERYKEEVKLQEDAALLTQEYKELGYDGYYRMCKENFINYMKQLNQKGVLIVKYEIDRIYRADNDYSIVYELTLSDGKEQFKGQGLDLRVGDKGIDVSGGYREDRKEESQDEAYQKLIKALFSWNNIQ